MLWYNSYYDYLEEWLDNVSSLYANIYGDVVLQVDYFFFILYDFIKTLETEFESISYDNMDLERSKRLPYLFGLNQLDYNASLSSKAWMELLMFIRDVWVNGFTEDTLVTLFRERFNLSLEVNDLTNPLDYETNDNINQNKLNISVEYEVAQSLDNYLSFEDINFILQEFNYLKQSYISLYFSDILIIRDEVDVTDYIGGLFQDVVVFEDMSFKNHNFPSIDSRGTLIIPKDVNAVYNGNNYQPYLITDTYEMIHSVMKLNYYTGLDLLDYTSSSPFIDYIFEFYSGDQIVCYGDSIRNKIQGAVEVFYLKDINLDIWELSVDNFGKISFRSIEATNHPVYDSFYIGGGSTYWEVSIEFVSSPTIPTLVATEVPSFSGEVDFIIFKGLYGYSWLLSVSETGSPLEGVVYLEPISDSSSPYTPYGPVDNFFQYLKIWDRSYPMLMDVESGSVCVYIDGFKILLWVPGLTAVDNGLSIYYDSFGIPYESVSDIESNISLYEPTSPVSGVVITGGVYDPNSQVKYTSNFIVESTLISGRIVQLPYKMIENSQSVYLNGLLLNEGVSEDYIVLDDVRIEINAALTIVSGDLLDIEYYSNFVNSQTEFGVLTIGTDAGQLYVGDHLYIEDSVNNDGLYVINDLQYDGDIIYIFLDKPLKSSDTSGVLKKRGTFFNISSVSNITFLTDADVEVVAYGFSVDFKEFKIFGRLLNSNLYKIGYSDSEYYRLAVKVIVKSGTVLTTDNLYLETDMGRVRLQFDSELSEGVHTFGVNRWLKLYNYINGW